MIAWKSGFTASKDSGNNSLLEAPDALRWAKGKELVLSLRICISSGTRLPLKKHLQVRKYATSAMMIKRGRYLDEILQRLIGFCLTNTRFHWISMPFSVPWMELMSQINTAVMKPNDPKRFKVHSNNHLQVSDQLTKSPEDQ